MWTLFTGTAAGTAKTLQDLFTAFSSWLTTIPTIKQVVEAITGGVGQTLAALTAFFALDGAFIQRVWKALGDALGITGGLTGLVTFFNTLAGNFTDFIKSIVLAITGIANGTLADLTAFFSSTGAFLSLVVKQLMFAINGSINGTLATLTQWASGIPALTDITAAVEAAIKSIVKAITNITNGDVAALTTWFATNVLKIDSDLPAVNLIGQLPAKILGLIPVSSLTDQAVNLLTDPTFLVVDSVSNTDGWSWDGTQTATGTGGSAKVVCDGYTKQLMNRTHFDVVPGNVLNLSAKIKTSGMTGTGWKVTLSAIEFHDNAMGVTTQVAARTTEAGPWTTISGDFTVPLGTTSMQFRLGVENANTGTVWFDDLDCHKTGLLKQDLVDNLNTTWENVYSGVFGGSGTGRRWPDAVTALSSVSSKTNTASATADTSLANILQTWNKQWESVFGGGAATGKTVEDFSTASGAVRATAATAYSTATTASTTAGTAQSTANSAASTASTAQSTASTANGTANAAQSNVVNTWNTQWETVYGGQATGKTLADYRTASGAVVSTASTAYTNANTAQGTANTANNNANAATSTANTANTTAGTANTNVLQTWLNLYGQYSQTAKIRQQTVPNLPGSIIDSGSVNALYIPGLDASKLTTGNVNINRIPTSEVGAVTNPKAGSGAQISRRNTDNVNSAANRQIFPAGFFDTQDRSGTNIVTTLSEGKFRVTEAGWYIVELSFRLNPTITFGFSVAPLLYKGIDSTQSAYKVGNDAIMGTWGFGQVGNRYAQSTWIVYLNAQEVVRAGYDAIGTAVNIFDADSSGVETYFSISMMNKTFG